MDVQAEIIELDERLKTAGVQLPEFCEQAGIHWTTWHRWKSGRGGPRLENWRKVEKAAEKLLEKQD